MMVKEASDWQPAVLLYTKRLINPVGCYFAAGQLLPLVNCLCGMPY
ncbi:MAG: hypothetical protein J7K66_03145 [Anaerolineaceae bacterium]|nr:hypothetical protein [Anaerolineaceae bacterium]